MQVSESVVVGTREETRPRMCRKTNNGDGITRRPTGTLGEEEDQYIAEMNGLF